jgi:RecJ-like exonuclease
MQEKINTAKARPEDRCERCMGRKKVMSAACWLVDCPVCKGAGFVKKEAVEGIQRLTDDELDALTKECIQQVEADCALQDAKAHIDTKESVKPVEPVGEAIEEHASELSALELVKMKRAKKKKG